MKTIVLTSVAALLLSTGCATKKYVAREVGEVNEKVAVVTESLEKTQESAQRNETRIAEVDRSAQTGITEAKDSASKAMTRAEEAERAAKGKLLYSLTLSNDKVTFPRNRARLSDEARQLVDDTLAPIVAENRGVYLEIEGHTDSTGSPAHNLRLGEERAMAVRNYLHDQHQIALNRMEVISYGEAKPVENNKTRANRAMNRRVVINVLE
jgi:outer membrane protein OmpA-like peptidoglycan-associated protein